MKKFYSLIAMLILSPVAAANPLCEAPNFRPKPPEECVIAYLDECIATSRAQCRQAARQASLAEIELDPQKSAQEANKKELSALEQREQKLSVDISLVDAELKFFSPAAQAPKPIFENGPIPEEVLRFEARNSWGELHPNEREERLRNEQKLKQAELLEIEAPLKKLRTEIKAVAENIRALTGIINVSFDAMRALHHEYTVVCRSRHCPGTPL